MSQSHHTFIWINLPIVLHEEIWESTMDMSANLLASFSCTEDANNRNGWAISVVGNSLGFGWQIRIQKTRTCLIVIDTV